MERYLDPYLNYLAERRRVNSIAATTIQAYRGKIQRALDYARGALLTHPLVSEWVRYQQLDARLRPPTIYQGVCAVRSFNKFVEQEYGIEGLATGKIWTPPLAESERLFPTSAEMDALWAAADSLPSRTLEDRRRRLMTLAWLCLSGDCALRRCEVLALRVRDIQLTAETPQVWVADGKGSKPRWVPFNSRCRRWLGEYLQVRREWCEQGIDRGKNTSLWVRDRIRSMNEESADRLRRDLLHQAGINRPILWHGFRHYRITEWLSVPGVNLKSVMALTGHRDLKSLMRYCHPRDEELQRLISVSAGGDLALPPNWSPPAEPAPAPARVAAAMPTTRYRRVDRRADRGALRRY